MYKNRIEVIGFVGQDPEVKATNNGRTYTRISIATTERWKDRDGNRRAHRVAHRHLLGPARQVSRAST